MSSTPYVFRKSLFVLNSIPFVSWSWDNSKKYKLYNFHLVISV
jgi:hypothetical protein